LTTEDRIAAVVVAFNGGEALLDCVRSLLAQSVPELEVIVVDNASTDGSIERAESAFGADIRVIRRVTNGGYAAGANTGWRATGAPMVAILNQDLVLEPDCLQRMREVVVDEPRDALVSPKLVLKSDPSRVNAVGNDVHLSAVSWCRGLGTPAADWHGIKEVTAISGAAFMTRRAVLEALGGLDESYFMYMEDIDLSFRARLTGATCLAACDAVAAHDWSLALTPWKFGLLERNRRRVWDRHVGPAAGRWLVLLQVEAMGWVYAALRGREHLKAKRRFLRSERAREAATGSPVETIVPFLSTRYPYHVLFPRSPAVAAVGQAVDRVVAWWLKVARGPSPIGTG
jgi:GT2 family glycosyltransferase